MRLYSPAVWDHQILEDDSPSDDNQTIEEEKAEDFTKKILNKKSNDRIKSGLTEGMFVQNYLSRLSTQ